MKDWTKKALLFTAFFAVIFWVYYITSPGNTPYNYFVYLADGFAHGRYWITDYPTWLNELIPWEAGRYYSVNPPAPAILLTPAVWLFGIDFPQQYLAHLLGALASIVVGIIALKATGKKSVAIWSILMTAFGTVLFYLSSVGSVWFLGQVSGFAFGMLALFECTGKKRVWLAGLFIAFAILSRQQTLFALPLYIYLLREELTETKKIFLFSASLAPAIVGIPFYNYLRFGNPLETGYRFIPGLLEEPWFQKGIFHYSYIPNHLKIMFTALPKMIDHWPYFIPSWGGMAIWATTPAFVYALWAPIKNNVVKMLWFTIPMIGLVNFCFGSTGFTQFGYRYAVDFYPFLVMLVILGVSRTGLKWHHWVLLVLGIIVNIWGVLGNNIYHWANW
jgi:hypothetical protein